MEFFKEWIACSKEYIFAPENHDLFFKKYGDVVIHQNLFHEQYFAASLIKKHGLRPEVKVIHKDAVKAGQNPRRQYTHYWGTTKTDRGNMARTRMRLLDEDPDLFYRIHNFCKKNKM